MTHILQLGIQNHHSQPILHASRLRGRISIYSSKVTFGITPAQRKIKAIQKKIKMCHGYAWSQYELQLAKFLEVIILFCITLVEPQKDKEYLGTVTKMCMNADYAAVMFDNRIQLHLVGFI